MPWLKAFLFLAAIPIAWAAPSSKELSRKTAQEKLVNVAATIQSHEAQLSAVEYDLNQARAEEDAILGELNHYNQRLMDTIHYLRHATQCSPLLAMLSAPKPEDVIHSSVLLRSITPEIHARNQQLLEKLQALSSIRTQLEAKQNQLRDITFHYHQERENLDTLLRGQPPSGPSDEISEGNLETLNLETLIVPVVGKLIPTYKSQNPEWAAFTQGVLFHTRQGAQVIAPLSGKIAFAGEYAQGQGRMVIIETPLSHVAMSGLGYLNCKVEQKVMAGEPIGRMPGSPSSQTKALIQNAQRLYLEVWRQEQTIDPQTILKGKGL